ncbi:MAG TPA: hypothetical protein VGJ81_05455 [Thermoanaerobaculia bacterium]|jgi:hypothetical protein
MIRAAGTTRNAVLDRAKLDGAIFDASTVWPRGFDPRRAGAAVDGETRRELARLAARASWTAKEIQFGA